MKNRVLIISGISVLAGGLAWYFINKSKQTRNMQSSLDKGGHAKGESMLHKILHKSKARAMNGHH